MALIQCPECGKTVSGRAEACIHCGYPLRECLEEATEEPVVDTPAEVLKEEFTEEYRKEPEKAVPETVRPRKYLNGRLAATAFITTSVGSLLLNCLTNIFIGRIGSDALVASSYSYSVASLLSRVLVILLIIAFFKRGKFLNYIALGYEATAALLMIAIPSALLSIYAAGIGDSAAFAASVACLRVTGILWLLMGGLCFLLGIVIRKKKVMFCIIFFAAFEIFSVLLTWIFTSFLGAAGAALGNMAQPFRLLLPLLLLNPDSEQ